MASRPIQNKVPRKSSPLTSVGSFNIEARIKILGPEGKL